MSNVQTTIVQFDTKVSVTSARNFYLREKLADVHFIFNSGERIPAHKLPLAGASGVFDMMFSGSVPEVGDIKIVDASSDAFKEFLQFFYLAKVQLSMENVGDVMYLGNKYDVTECMDLCEKLLQLNLSSNNVCGSLEIAIMYDRMKLKKMCERKIYFFTKEVFNSTDFLECSKQVLEHILNLDQLSCSEVDVFKACMSWVKNVSKKGELAREMVKEHMGNLFYEIRFRSMAHNDFVNLLPAYESIFSKGELCEILQMIQNKAYEPKQFNGIERILSRIEWNENAVIYCNRFICIDRPYLMGHVDVTQLTANKTLFLGSIYCAPIFKNDNCEHFDEKVPVDVTITTATTRKFNQSKISEDKVIYKGKFDLNKVGPTAMELTAPILIHAGVKYEFRFDLQQSVFGYSELKREVRFDSDIKLKFHNDSNPEGNAQGLICHLYFNRTDYIGQNRTTDL